MKHSGILSFLVFGFGYLTGISMLFAEDLHFKFAGCLLISYFTFLLISEIESKEWEHNYHYLYYLYNPNFWHLSLYALHSFYQ